MIQNNAHTLVGHRQVSSEAGTASWEYTGDNDFPLVTVYYDVDFSKDLAAGNSGLSHTKQTCSTHVVDTNFFRRKIANVAKDFGGITAYVSHATNPHSTSEYTFAIAKTAEFSEDLKVSTSN